jgi:hypothetical protein
MTNILKVRAALTEGGATTDELQAEFGAKSGKRNMLLRRALNRMQRHGEIRRRPMFSCAYRGVRVVPVVVWELVR